MRRPGDHKIREILVTQGMLDAKSADAALAAAGPDVPATFVQLVTGRYGVDEAKLLEAVSSAAGVPFENLDGIEPPAQALKIIPVEHAGKHRLLPLRIEEGELVIAVSDPFDVFAQDDLRLRTGMELRLVLTSDKRLDEAIARAYSPRPAPADAPLDDVIASLEDPACPASDEPSPAIAFLNNLLADAVARGVEAIHIEPDPGEPDVRIRFREAGRKLTRVPVPASIRLATVIARLKILAELDISERRRPQDGRLKGKTSGVAFDFRCATFPTAAGESLVLYSTRQPETARSLAETGAPEAFLAAVRRALASGGLILEADSDPRRRGALLGLLAREADGENRVVLGIGCEPTSLPAGALAMSVNPEAGITFASGLHAAMRQDPDVIVLAEIRDNATLSVALDCAEAGIAVLASLFVEEAAHTIERLAWMGADMPRVAELFKLAVGRSRGNYEFLETSSDLKRKIAAGKL
ncbi:MAG: Flp pilus assembly complex ATPase component TadA [Elusimicrobia bacterium]|nr:Flp pilus assembly complex ATPase component TadA [Elusimicrobiota bacterium]